VEGVVHESMFACVYAHVIVFEYGALSIVR